MPPVPIVVLQYKMNRALELPTRMLASQLPGIVATALSAGYAVVACAEQPLLLKPSDISVLSQPICDFDLNTKDIEIIVWAHARSQRSMWRLYDCDDVIDAIVNNVRKILSDYGRNISGSVRILLQPIAFGEF